MNKIKVLIATGIFPPQVGGPATYSKLLLEELPKRGLKVRVENFGDVLKYPKVFRHTIYFCRIIVSGMSADVIYAMDPVSTGLPALLAAKVLRKKFYLKIVGDYAWEQGSQRFGVTDLLDEFSLQKDKYSIFVRIFKEIQFFVAERADKILVPSNYLKKIVSNWGIHEDKITVVYNAFKEPNVQLTKTELRKTLGYKNKVIISAGRLVPWKGFDTLIEILPSMREEIGEITLYIAGSGPDHEKLEKKIFETKSENSVILLGKVEQAELFKLIKAADLFVLNTSYEGLSHQILEVMSLGTPLITTKAGGNFETIDTEKNGILVEYNDREALKKWIKELLVNKKYALNLAQEAKKKLKIFNEERMLEEVTRFLRG